jgi:hypothetical protein
VILGHATLAISATGSPTVTLTPSRRVRAILAAHRHQRVKLTVAYAATEELSDTQSKTITDNYRLPSHTHHG